MQSPEFFASALPGVAGSDIRTAGRTRVLLALTAAGMAAAWGPATLLFRVEADAGEVDKGRAPFQLLFEPGVQRALSCTPSPAPGSHEKRVIPVLSPEGEPAKTPSFQAGLRHAGAPLLSGSQDPGSADIPAALEFSPVGALAPAAPNPSALFKHLLALARLRARAPPAA